MTTISEARDSAYDWVGKAVFYQIYPQSFLDTNGDGVGDFPGITSRLDYIKSLGVDAIWLNPCFDSPFGDAGYDIRDFYKVAPRYGTEEELIRLFEGAHRRGMRVILDLVAGHTSMDNEWFLAEAANPKSPDSNRYVWLNRDFDPAVGPARGDFLGNFFWYQPALNYGYAEPSEPWQDSVDAPGPRKNREELRRIMAYWFDRGCDGFRVDMAGSLIKIEGQPRAQAETQRLWQEIRRWIDETYPGKALLAEWSCPTAAIDAGFHLDFLMHFNAPGYPSLFFNGVGSLPAKEGPCYFHRDGEGQLKIFREEYQRQLQGVRGKGFISLPVANHDFQRLHCGPRSAEELRCAWVFFLTQAGPPTIYYGEEIGMRYLVEAPSKEGSTLAGITAVNAGAANGERAGSRTPMQWDDTDNAGFSSAAPGEIYLPLDPDPDRPTVVGLEKDPESLLHFVRKLIALRREHMFLGADASYEILNPDDQPYPFLCVRRLDGAACIIAINPTSDARTITVALKAHHGEFLLNVGCEIVSTNGNLALSLGAFGYVIVELLHSS